MTDELEKELARRFADLGRADEASAPPLSSVLSRTRPKRALSPWALPAAAAALLAVLVLVAFPHSAPRHPAAMTELAQWRSPTSSLLDTPGSDLLRETPRVGGTGFSAIAPPPSPSTSPTEKGAPS